MIEAPEPKDKLDASASVVANGPEGGNLGWRAIDWRVCEASVRRVTERNAGRKTAGVDGEVAQCPERGLLAVFAFARSLPSTASAPGRPGLFGGFVATTGLSDFPRSCISGVWQSPSPSGPPTGRPEGASPISLAAQTGSDRAGSTHNSRRRYERCCLPPAMTASAPRTDRGSMNQPARTAADASPTPSRTSPHSSRPLWVATPST